MTILTSLTGRATIAADWREPRGIIASVHHEIKKGDFCHLKLGSGGLVIRHRTAELAIPIEALLTLALPHLADPSGSSVP